MQGRVQGKIPGNLLTWTVVDWQQNPETQTVWRILDNIVLEFEKIKNAISLRSPKGLSFIIYILG